ncbi:MAG: nucleotidyltransferase domain-containing protein [Armatimonadetes bacterium]|nr:nucleotidyltransferase domain-containing protein [Armatimonadota bacterium]
MKTYTVRDPASPLIAGLRELFDREEQRMRSAVAELAESAPEVRAIVLFGSEARGEARPGSDTDLLMVVDKADPVTVDQVRDACLEVAERHGLALAWHVADLGQLREWEATQDRFWENVVQDGIWLHGESLEAIGLRWRPGRTISGRPAVSGN